MCSYCSKKAFVLPRSMVFLFFWQHETLRSDAKIENKRSTIWSEGNMNNWVVTCLLPLIKYCHEQRTGHEDGISITFEIGFAMRYMDVLAQIYA